MSFSDENLIWKLYTKYVCILINKNKNKDNHLLMTPGLFCQYFAIELHRVIAAGNQKTMKTYEIIIEKIAIPNCEFSNHPAGPIGFMEIFRDDDGDLLEICNWKY